MRQTYTILPVYTGDVSGVCSALYELGGMVVMHDPSGCNSTYNTHDEIRWYDHDSLIFLSGLCEPDAIMGNDAKFIDDVVRAAQELSPDFIALCNSPIPYLTGTDFAGICRIIEQRTGIPSFYIPTNGMHDYISGAGLAFEKLAEKLFGEQESKSEADPEAGIGSGERSPAYEQLRQRESDFPRENGNRRLSVNILGMTPLDYAADTCCRSLRDILEQSGWLTRSVWAMGDSLEHLRQAGTADVNLVVSASGLKTAQYLQKRFGTPWVAGVPVENTAEQLSERMRLAAAGGGSGPFYGCEKAQNKDLPEYIVIGEPVLSCSIAEHYRANGFTAKVIAATEESGQLLRPGDLTCRGEEEMERALEQLCGPGTVVVADPMYGYVLPKGVSLIQMPHLAFSGRIYRHNFTDPFRFAFVRKGESDES